MIIGYDEKICYVVDVTDSLRKIIMNEQKTYNIFCCFSCIVERIVEFYVFYCYLNLSRIQLLQILPEHGRGIIIHTNAYGVIDIFKIFRYYIPKRFFKYFICCSDNIFFSIFQMCYPPQPYFISFTKPQ